uniref:Uncharacterized protein n=1 Tax=Cacopsylla melanoneura TaxID=428564 RepID=A0A8D8SCA8_9HEMI
MQRIVRITRNRSCLDYYNYLFLLLLLIVSMQSVVRITPRRSRLVLFFFGFLRLVGHLFLFVFDFLVDHISLVKQLFTPLRPLGFVLFLLGLVRMVCVGFFPFEIFVFPV